MIIAALDTSFGVSFALTRVGKSGVDVLASVVLNEQRGALQKLHELVNKVLVDARLELANVDRWVIGVGPGSFTGIRIGIAFVKGICLPLEKPFMGVLTTLALARQAKKQASELEKIAVCFDGRRQELIYSSVTMGPNPVIDEAKVVTKSDFDQMLQNNEAVVTLHHDVVKELLPNANILAFESVAAEGLVSCEMITDFTLTIEEMEASCEPIYVRPAVFTNPLFIRTI